MHVLQKSTRGLGETAELLHLGAGTGPASGRVKLFRHMRLTNGSLPPINKNIHDGGGREAGSRSVLSREDPACHAERTTPQRHERCHPLCAQLNMLAHSHPPPSGRPAHQYWNTRDENTDSSSFTQMQCSRHPPHSVQVRSRSPG